MKVLVRSGVIKPPFVHNSAPVERIDVSQLPHTVNIDQIPYLFREALGMPTIDGLLSS